MPAEGGDQLMEQSSTFFFHPVYSRTPWSDLSRVLPSPLQLFHVMASIESARRQRKPQTGFKRKGKSQLTTPQIHSTQPHEKQIFTSTNYYFFRFKGWRFRILADGMTRCQHKRHITANGNYEPQHLICGSCCLWSKWDFVRFSSLKVFLSYLQKLMVCGWWIISRKLIIIFGFFHFVPNNIIAFHQAQWFLIELYSSS